VFKLNRRVSIPEPQQDLGSLQAAVVAMKESVEVLAGQRGNPRDAAVTWQDLIDLGLIIPSEIPQGIGSSGFQRAR
jgi:hypothetical protein